MIKNFFNVAGADAVKRIAEWIRHKFYTKTEIDEMLSAGMKYEVVEELPATGEAGTIYLVPKQSASTGDVYDEYVYVDGSYEHIGSTDIDLSNYYTKTEADDLLDDKVDKVNGKGLSAEDYTTAEKTKLANIEAGAEVNVQSDWNQSDSTADDFIKNKPTLRQPASDGTSGQYLKSNGSGNAPSWETMDSAPTESSTKAVTSGGVKTALDGKQASISITTKTDDAGDNDKVILQDNGVTNTTTFVRRSLSNLLNWFRSKLDSVYVPFEWVITNNDNFSGSAGKHVYNLKIDDGFFGANKRWSVTREIFNIESGELVTTQNVSQLFDGNFERLFTHPTEGEKEVITITPASGATSLKTYFSGTICLHFYNTREPLSATLKISVKDTPTTFQTYSFSPYRGKVWRSESFNKVYPHTVIVEIIGKSYTGDDKWVATALTEMSYFGTRNTIGEESALVKHEIAQEMFGNLTAPKFITRNGTSSQYLRGDGSLTTLSTSPTSGSGLPITSGAVYTALNNKQNKFLAFDIPDNAGCATLTLISDITESFSTQNWTGHGIVGFMYGFRSGNLAGSTAQRITCWGNHDTSYVKLQTDNNHNNALKPLLVYYNSRYYLALKKGKRSGMTHYFIGPYSNLLSTYINLYANSNESKWYSDSGRTTEVTFTVTKDYSRYEGGYLDFMGNSSQVVLGTGELKTIDSSVASGSSNLVTSGAVATAIAGMDMSGKVNLQPDFTASQIDYSAGNVGKWQKVLRFPDGADLVINMKKTAMGADSASTLWFSSSSMGDSYTSLFGNHSVRFVHDGGYVFLVLACRKSTNEPIETYTFQIAHSSVPMSDIVAVTDASPITATPKEPNIVYRAPVTTGAVSFNVNSSGAGSVSMSNHNDFVGNMTSEASNGVVVTMSGATEGQIYRFVFTRNITGGVTFKQSNVAYCTIANDVNAGDTITLTAVSNTADGWLYEQESAGIESSDGSNIVEYNGSTADVRVNWDKLPARVVMNVADDDYKDDNNIAIGYGASTYKLTDDESYPYAYTLKAELCAMKVDGGEEEYTHAVTAGTTYSIVRGSVTTSFTPAHSGYAVVLDLGSGYELATGTRYISQLIAPTYAGTVVLYDATENGNAQYQIVVVTINSTYISRIVEGSYMLAWYKSESRQNALALGREASATGMSAVALGKNAGAKDFEAVAVGKDAKAIGLHSTAVGCNSQASGYLSAAYGASTYARKWQSTAVGTYAESDGQYASAFGSQAKANGTYATAVGQASQALVLLSTTVGYSTNAYNAFSAIVGISSSIGGVSGDSERPYLTAKAFSGAKFSTGGNEVYNAFIPSGGDIVITVGGTSYTLTSPSASGRMLFVINEADAQYILRSLLDVLELDGALVSSGGTPTGENASVEHLTGNYYAVWIRYSSSNPVVATQSLKFYASISRASNDSVCAVVGSYNKVMNSTCVAVGAYLYTLQSGQVILGRYNKPVEGYLIVGSGANTGNGRKNCLVIDSSERMVINAGYVGGTQEINMNSQTGTLSNITKSVYKIKWNGVGTIRLTLGTDGCVEGQRVSIVAVTNDVQIFATTILIPLGTFGDFLFIDGEWIPSSGIWNV